MCVHACKHACLYLVWGHDHNPQALHDRHISWEMYFKAATREGSFCSMPCCGGPVSGLQQSMFQIFIFVHIWDPFNQLGGLSCMIMVLSVFQGIFFTWPGLSIIEQRLTGVCWWFVRREDMSVEGGEGGGGVVLWWFMSEWGAPWQHVGVYT